MSEWSYENRFSTITLSPPLKRATSSPVFSETHKDLMGPLTIRRVCTTELALTPTREPVPSDIKGSSSFGGFPRHVQKKHDASDDILDQVFDDFFLEKGGSNQVFDDFFVNKGENDINKPQSISPLKPSRNDIPKKSRRKNKSTSRKISITYQRSDNNHKNETSKPKTKNHKSPRITIVPVSEKKTKEQQKNIATEKPLNSNINIKNNDNEQRSMMQQQQQRQRCVSFDDRDVRVDNKVAPILLHSMSQNDFVHNDISNLPFDEMVGTLLRQEYSQHDYVLTKNMYYNDESSCTDHCNSETELESDCRDDPSVSSQSTVKDTKVMTKIEPEKGGFFCYLLPCGSSYSCYDCGGVDDTDDTSLLMLQNGDSFSTVEE